jgi:hypothetical protein
MQSILSTHETLPSLEARASVSALPPSPADRALPFMLRLTAWISLVIGVLSGVLFIGELVNGNTSEAPSAATVAGSCIFTGLLFLALAALLRWVQLIEWRLGLRSVGEHQHNR